MGKKTTQKYVSRKELTDMEVGQVQVFYLEQPTKLQAAATTCSQLKREGKGEWRIKRDFDMCAIIIERTK